MSKNCKIIKRVSMKKLLTIIAVLVMASPLLLARPQYSILQTYGTKCSNCHVNNNYGGMRNSGGFIARNSISIIKPEWLGMEGLYDFLSDKNSYMDDAIQWGIDFRYQNARWGQTQKLSETRDTNDVPIRPTLERKGMIMQLMPYLNIQATEWLRIDGSYNFSYDIEPNMRYKGQQPGYARATFDIMEDLPTVSVGYFPPDMALDYDDHTMLVRTVAGKGRSNPLVPADYAELGIQFNYDRLSWLSASLGFFESKNMGGLTLEDNSPVVNKEAISSVLNINVNSELPGGFIGFAGMTNYLNGNLKTDNGIYLGNGYYNITSFFLGVGMSDNFALLAEYMTSNKQLASAVELNGATETTYRSVNNLLLELTYQLIEPVNIFARYETAATKIKATGETYEANQYVFGSHIYLLPYIDLLPEYRIYDRGEVSGYSSQWAFQIHIFY